MHPYKPHNSWQRRSLLLLSLSAALLSGCEPISMTVMSIGASAGVSHTLGGIIYRTFTAPARTVQRASQRALNTMGIVVVDTEINDDGETVIYAKAKERDIRILLEPITPQTTRMRATASNGLLLDSATAQEIVAQTEQVLSHTIRVAARHSKKS
jgi:hypothetical protein